MTTETIVIVLVTLIGSVLGVRGGIKKLKQLPLVKTIVDVITMALEGAVLHLWNVYGPQATAYLKQLLKEAMRDAYNDTHRKEPTNGIPNQPQAREQEARTGPPQEPVSRS